MKNLFYILLSIVLLSSCKKEPGIGGDAKIKGHVTIRDYNSIFTVLLNEYPAEDVYVYIVFGDNDGFDKRVKTDYEGNFQFEHLYKGDYELYVYSKDSTLTDPNEQVPVITYVNIEERKEVVDLGEIIIFD